MYISHNNATGSGSRESRLTVDAQREESGVCFVVVFERVEWGFARELLETVLYCNRSTYERVKQRFFHG
jgi:hypothetical protein